MNSQIEITSPVSILMNSRRQFWDLWFTGINPLIEIESKIMHLKDNKEPENSLHKLTNTILDEQEKILNSYFEKISEVANQNNSMAGGDSFNFWKKEVKNIGELEKESLLGLSPWFNLFAPQKMLERMNEFVSMMNKSFESMGEPVSSLLPVPTTNSAPIMNSTKPADTPVKKAKSKPKHNAPDIH